ncbi:hypothetical protein [Sinosporangium siamense]|uniref:Uncharacterized protein n=1 Tax=Sinosporangium siamense TaxID=1367973 RepID=A0A919V5K3_9ACTN|nr:hypothetical protein [Sinosporangium siamense]GII91623.1 hypothetical protein Ssi02_18540 [Sinosporangium siamense]
MGAQLYGSRLRWREIRRYLNRHRHELVRSAAGLYPDVPKVGATHLLTRPEWLPDRPLPLLDTALVWTDPCPAPSATGGEPEARGGLPEDIPTYSQAMEALDRPLLFENRSCYRLLEVDLPRLTFGRGTYFDGLNVTETVAHEYTAAHLLGENSLEFRGLIGDPTDLSRRSTTIGLCMLTLRRDRRTGDLTFVLHFRDAARVAQNGGMFQVIPVGVFQPSEETPRAEAADFDLWKCAIREYSEEFLGGSEHYGDGFAYDDWPFYRRMEDARAAGQVHSHILGVGVDPLSFSTDVLAVTVFDSEIFDKLFSGMAATNAEGTLIGAGGIRFDAGPVERYIHREPMQAAGAAALDLAWKHRDLLTS